MWLINCRTLTLEEHLDFKSIEYAILSHTWEQGQEVQFDEFRSGTAKEKTGWDKIRYTCRLAIEDGYELAWVDTCCINKASSAELSEAINSMFDWYKWSRNCYVYLADYDGDRSDQELGDCRWFSRGWALQELIAPTRVRFFDRMWNFLGQKDGLSEHLSLITGIEQGVLLASDHKDLELALEEVPVARKMSWASNRHTTRVEDTAYSLFGIFGLNLPLLYGEGERAFIRLQEEIIRNSHDLSFLAWSTPSMDKSLHCGVLAPHPQCFRDSGHLAPIKGIGRVTQFTSTKRGLRFQTQFLYHDKLGLYALDINCTDIVSSGRPLSIRLRRNNYVYVRGFHLEPMPQADSSEGGGKWVRDVRTLFLDKSTKVSIIKSTEASSCAFFAVTKPPLELMLWHLSDIYPKHLWQDARARFKVGYKSNFVGYQKYTPTKPSTQELDLRPFQVIFGSGYECKPRYQSDSGYGFDSWIRVVDVNSDEKINRELKQENWERVAQLANNAANRPLCIGKDKTQSVAMILRAGLRPLSEHGINGQQVYIKVEKWNTRLTVREP